MATYFMFGDYTAEALRGISSDRTKEVSRALKKYGGEVKEIYTLLGEHDVVMIVDLPGTKEAMQASVALGQLTNIAFHTTPAGSAEEFDKAMASR